MVISEISQFHNWIGDGAREFSPIHAKMVSKAQVWPLNYNHIRCEDPANSTLGPWGTVASKLGRINQLRGTQPAVPN